MIRVVGRRYAMSKNSSGVFRTTATWLKGGPIIPAALLSLIMSCVFAVRLISGQSGAGEGARHGTSSTAAIERFWAIYHGNDYNAIPEIQSELQGALDRDPGNATLYALLGATHFWHFGEYTRDPKATPASLQQDISSAVQLFENALNIDYYRQHLIGYVNDDHLPGYLGITMAHAGQLSNNANLMAKADQVLDYAVYQFPEFNNFNRWAAHNTDPKDSETYKKALDSLWQAIDACVGGVIDRTNPDVRQYLYLQTPVGRKKACWSQGTIAPHSFEGLVLNLANGLVKAGQVDAARIMYGNAKYADNYATWPYREVLESIAASDLDARAALYADTNPMNDPPLGVPNRGCVYCHATVAEFGATGH
jgi:hypothetical protein